MSFRHIFLPPTLLAIALLGAGTALAGDGVLEINKACRNSGCFAGDEPGAPIQITLPGSYRLTSNLDVNQNTTAIDITADDVTLDLNGFAILGPTTCTTQDPPACSSTGIGIGIASDGDNITIMNGTVTGMGRTCIDLRGANSRVSGISIFHCGEDGLAVDRGYVQDVTVSRVGNIGIGGIASVAYVRDSLVRGTAFGISAGACDNVVTQFAGGNNCPSID